MCERCGNDLLNGFCSYCNSRNSYVYDSNPNSFDYPPDPCHPPHLIYETYSCDSYGNNSYFGYDCQPRFPLNYESEPGYIENYNSYPYDSSSSPQQYPCCTHCGGPHETCQCDQLIFDEPYCKNYGGHHMNFQCQPMNQNFYNSNSFGFDHSQPPQFPVIHQPPQKMSIQEMEDLKQQYLDEMKRLINLEYRDEIKIYELKENFNSIKALNDNPTPSSDFMTKSSSTSLNSLLEETNTFDNSLPKFKTFCFDVEEISSGKISSGSTTTHSDSSLYDSFIFDLLINPFPPVDRSIFYEFADELIHIISPLEYDCFLFKIKPNSGDFTMDVVEDISPTREPRVYNALPTHPTLKLNLEFQPSSESLFTYVVWTFLTFLLYSVAPQYLLSLRNEDTIFDPGICNYHFFPFRPDVSHRCGTFPRFKVLNESPMEIFSSTCSPMDQ
nr:hypothetical protein [Tanacetum cinerariifolium]